MPHNFSPASLAVDEVIPHPSYFRIAFDNDGENGFVEPASIKPIDPSRKCPYNGKDQCGESDFCNNETVLWDNLDPHISGGSSWSWNVKLPDIECENCTIQVLQIMEDVIHGAYCPTGSCEDDSLEDIYHRCINVTLKKGATNSPGTTTAAINNKGMECPQKAAPPASEDAGATTTSSDAGAVAPTETGAGRDASTATKPTKDAGTTTDEDEPSDDDEDESDDAPATGSKKDAGTTKKDAGADADHDDHDDAKPAVDDGGCSVVAGSRGDAASALSLLLTLATCLVARKRRQRS